MSDPECLAGAGRWLPKLCSSLHDYSLRHFVSDLIAGITVGLVALEIAAYIAIVKNFPILSGRRNAAPSLAH